MQQNEKKIGFWPVVAIGIGAKDGELPEVLERKLWNRPVEGLLITSGATLLVANLFDLSSISTMGSAGFLLIFAAVNAANAHLASKTGSRRWISVVGSLLCLGALSSLILYIAFKIMFLGCVIGRRGMFYTASSLWPCQKHYLKYYTWQHRPSHVWVLAAMLALAFAVEGGYRPWRRGDLMLRERSVESASPGAGE